MVCDHGPRWLEEGLIRYVEHHDHHNHDHSHGHGHSHSHDHEHGRAHNPQMLEDSTSIAESEFRDIACKARPIIPILTTNANRTSIMDISTNPKKRQPPVAAIWE